MPAIAVNNLADFSVGGKGPQTSPISNAFQAMYDESTDAVLHGTGQETFEAVKMLKAADPAQYQPAAGVVYPNTPFGNSLKQIAQLLKANLGVEAAFSDIGGWDTHQNQGNVNGQLANRLKEFSESIAAFWKDMGDDAENVTLVTMSEFGRTARQNGTGGTDHGHANVMFVLGGQVKGGKVYGKWPGLANEQLNEGRDLTVTTDFRRVLGEAAYKTLGSRNLDMVFPGAQVKPESVFELYLESATFEVCKCAIYLVLYSVFGISWKYVLQEYLKNGGQLFFQDARLIECSKQTPDFQFPRFRFP